MIHLDSVYENIGDEEVLVNRVFDENGRRLGQIYYDRSKIGWQPREFHPEVTLKINELKEISTKCQTVSSSGMPFLCLGTIEHQHKFFALELKRVFEENISNITAMEAPWGGQTVYICEAETAIHSEIKSFVTGFRSGFKSAL